MNGADKYRRLGRATVSSRGELHALFTELMAAVAAARSAIAEGRLEAAHRHLILAQQVLTALRLGLPEEPAVLTANLKALYDHCVALLGRANMAKSVEDIDAALKVLGVLRDAWQEAALSADAAPMAAATAGTA